MKKVLLWTAAVVLVAAAALSLNSTSIAADDTAALKEQVQKLNDRIAQLEKQLAYKQTLAPRTQPANYALSGGWDPFAEMEYMQRAMNQMFREPFSLSMGLRGQDLFNPKIDIKESPGHYTITLDIPGMDKDNIEAKVEGRNLIISGERTSESEETSPDKFFHKERSFGHFIRVVPLPENAKTDVVDAQYNNGVLTVKVGRMDNNKKAVQKIQIK